MQNVYIDGINMPETMLIHKFKIARGNRIAGYLKVMEQKGLVEKREEGTIVPTYKYQFYE